MDNKKDNLSVNMNYDEAQTIPLALHEMHMARKDRTIKRLIIGFVIVIIAILIATTYERLQYDYTGTTTTEYSGVYNLTDSEGNVISSDITPEDVIRIMETLNGKREDNQNQNP